MKQEKSDLQNTIRFQSSSFNLRKGSIIKSCGEEVFMGDRLKDLFTILIKNENEVVTREELMSFVWKDVIVTEDSITKAVSDLRGFLNRNGFENIDIISIRKLGYKLRIKKSDPALVKDRPLARSLMKVFAFSILLFFFIIILIRAVNY